MGTILAALLVATMAAAWRSSGWLAGAVRMHPMAGQRSAPGQAGPMASASMTGTFTVINAPGAGTGALQGTIPIGINSGGAITGVYAQSSGVLHGFVRAADGTFSTFDAPSAAKTSGRGTIPIGINSAGDVTGVSIDSNTVSHGFLRAPDGTLTSFDAPGAGTVANRGTIPMAINDAGQVVGFYANGSLSVDSVYHGFLRAHSGAITVIDDPKAGTVQDPNTGRKQGTQPFAINAAGEISGSFVDANMERHGFFRTASGAFSNFDPHNAGTSTTGKHESMNGTAAAAIDSSGVIAGGYTDTSDLRHGFIRAAGGTITVFDPVGSSAGPGILQGTLARSIDPTGEYIGGFFADSSGLMHGFVRKSDGTTTVIDAPSAGGVGTSIAPGTATFAVNEYGEATGAYADANGSYHGFLYKPASTVAAATPKFTPVAGTYTGTQTVKIADATSGAAIHYTTDGSAPTATSAKYSTPIAVTKTTTIKALAVASGYANSAVATATYTIRTATPVFTPIAGNYSKAQKVTITDATAGAAIYYTLDGTAPTTKSNKYAGTIAVTANVTTLKAMATATGHANSTVATATYKIGLPAAAAPKFSVGTGTYSAAQTVKITDATAGTGIYYTTDGTGPTTASKKYTAALTISKTTTLKAIAASATRSNSAVTTATYTITGKKAKSASAP